LTFQITEGAASVKFITDTTSTPYPLTCVAQ
jgi:hypothetical protein